MKSKSFGAALVITSVISTVAGAVFGVLLLLIFAATNISANDPLLFAVPFAIGTLLAAAFVSGSLGAVIGRRERLPFAVTGSLCGGIFIIILSVLSVFSSDSSVSLSLSARCVLYLGILALSLFGATLFRAREKTHARYKAPRRRKR